MEAIAAAVLPYVCSDFIEEGAPDILLIAACHGRRSVANADLKVAQTITKGAVLPVPNSNLTNKKFGAQVDPGQAWRSVARKHRYTYYAGHTLPVALCMQPPREEPSTCGAQCLALECLWWRSP
eukprot:358980-Chlamydomonas_euryale.AAC.3